MKYITIVLLCLVCVSPLLADSWENTSWDNTRYNTTEGTEFYATFIKNAGETKDSENLALYLQAVASRTTKVKVTYLSDYSTEEFIVNEGTQVTRNINITKAYADYDNTPGKLPTEQITKCAIYVTSDNPISLYITNSLKNAYSGTCVLPTKALGKDYVVQTYLADKTSTEFAVVGTEDVTSVTFNIQRTELDEDALSVDDGVFVDTVTYEEFNITLNRGEVFLYLSNKAEVGISGTRICADKPIAVFNGNQFARIPYFKDENQTHLSTQTYPIDRWGKQYVVTPTLKNDKEHVRITAFENNTIIQKNGSFLCKLNAFETYQDTIYACSNYYQASNPAACFLYTLTSGALNNHVAGRPSMTPITPLEYATNSLLFATFTSSKSNMLKNHYVNVVTHEDYVKTMLLDGSSIASSFKNDILVGSEKYKYAQIPISALAHCVSNSNPKGVFVARIYGMGTNDRGTVGESYAYAAGSRISRKIDILVDGQYVREKTICKGAPAIDFEGLIGFELDGNDEVSWCIKEIGDVECDTVFHENIDGSYLMSHYFQTDSVDKDFEVSLIVTQNAPSICDGCNYTNTVSDTVKVYIHLKTTYGFKNINNYCYGTEFTLHKDSIIYNIVADTVNTYTPLFSKPFEINRQYNITDRLYSKNGCDSIIQQIFYIRVPDTIVIDTAICDDQLPFVWHLDPFTGEKDSIIIDTIRGEKVTVTRSQSYNNRYGCESLAKLNLQICPVFIDTTIVDTCQQPVGRTYRWLGHENHYVYDVNNKRKIRADKIPINIPGEFTYIDSLKTEPCDDCPSAGCDSIWVLDLTVSPVYSFVQDTTISNEDYIEWQGLKIGGEDAPINKNELDFIITKDTIIKTVYPTEFDCDSTYILNIHYGKLFRDTTDATICENELEYIWYWNGRALDTIAPLPTKDTTYVHTTKSSIGVDSIFYLNLSIHPISTYTHSVAWCRSAGPYNYPSIPEYPLHNLQGLLESDVYRDTLYGANQYGCDSIIELHLEVLDTIVVPIYHSLCDNELPYNHPDKSADNLQNLTVSGVYRDTLISKLTGCDSIVVLHLQVNYQTQYDTTIYVCENHLPFVDSHTKNKYTYSTSYNDTILNSVGCDSIIHVNLVVTDTFHTYLDTVICESYSPYNHPDIRANGLQNLTRSGVYRDTIPTYQYGCDSILILNLTINPTIRSYHSITWCRSAGAYDYPSSSTSYLSRLHGLLSSGVYRDTLSSLNQYGCDSIIELKLTVLDTIVEHVYESVCDNELPYNHLDTSAHKLQNLTVTGTYRDTLVSKLTGCDSIVVLHLQVNYQTQYDTTIYVCENHLPFVDSHTNNKYTYSTSYNDTILNSVGCDSIIHVNLVVTDIFHTYLDTVICESYSPYNHPDIRANGLQNLTRSGVYRDTIPTYQYGCDSILILNLTINPTTRSYHSITWCRSAGPYSYPSTPEYPLPNLQGLLESKVYKDTLYGANQYGCDSIIELHLDVLDTIVVPIYYSLCDNELPYNHPDKSADNLQNLTKTGVYRDTLVSKLTGCDSVVVLHLQVNSTYNTPIEISICDNELPYTWVTHDAYGMYTKEFNIDSTDVFPIVKYDSMMLQSIFGCDSLVLLTLRINKTYEFLQRDSVCQDPINKYWEWIDKFGGKHDSIDISQSGWITIADSLKTVNGCDSVFGIQLYVKPSYRFDSIYTICQNERIDWQGRGYSGDNYGWHYERKETNSFGMHVDSIYYKYEIGDTILSHGVHYDTVRYTTSLGCDSIYYLKLVIMPTNNTIIEASACDNDSFYVFTTNDIYDSYNDTIFIQPITRWVDSLHKDTAFYMYERTLQTKSGCDSVVHLHLTIYPSYQYTDYARICQNTKFEWHGNKYNSSGVYYDSCLTEYGCDSVHILNLYVKPVLEIYIDTNICDNQLLMHSDTLWYGKDSTRFDTINTVLWKPGMEIPKPNESRYIRYQSYDGECDSIIYKYSIHVNPTFRTDTFVTLCSNEVLLLNDFSISLDTMYSVDYSISAIDTILMDTLQTIHGCDSVLVCHAHILPAYKYIDYDTICESDTCFWRDTMFVDMLPGDHSLVDNMTSIYGCDSIYELRLHVNPIYEFEYDTTICSNELFIFYGDTLTETGTYHANHPSIYACDSVTTLHLTVHDTTFNLLYDTICISEKYRFRDSIITQTGHYAFVSTNEWGCMQYDSICLTVIDTTTYTLYIGDILCADEEELMVEYEVVSGPELIEYSVLFDQFGHSQGFEDIYHAPLDTKGRYLSIPLPKGEVLPHPTPTYFDSQQGVNQYTYDDKYAYPLPANYHITVIMHNAICGDTLQRKDTTFNLLYPSWIHEQHWNDGIVLYNDMYNGGHKFSAYQWYQNGDTIYGATKEYLHIPSDLLMNDRGNCENYYQVELTRESDGYKTMTCPICPVLLGDTIVPTKDYFSIVPTIVDHRNPIVHILSTKPGKYSYVPYNLLGQGVEEHKQGTFVPNGNNYAGIIDLSGLGTGTILINVIVDDQPRAFYITIN